MYTGYMPKTRAERTGRTSTKLAFLWARVRGRLPSAFLSITQSTTILIEDQAFTWCGRPTRPDPSLGMRAATDAPSPPSSGLPVQARGHVWDAADSLPRTPGEGPHPCPELLYFPSSGKPALPPEHSQPPASCRGCHWTGSLPISFSLAPLSLSSGPLGGPTASLSLLPWRLWAMLPQHPAGAAGRVFPAPVWRVLWSLESERKCWEGGAWLSIAVPSLVLTSQAKGVSQSTSPRTEAAEADRWARYPEETRPRCRGDTRHASLQGPKSALGTRGEGAMVSLSEPQGPRPRPQTRLL